MGKDDRCLCHQTGVEHVKSSAFTSEAAYNILGNGDEDGIRSRSRLASDSKAL